MAQYIGLDVHSKETAYGVQDETGTQVFWVSRLLAELDMEPRVIDAYEVRRIAYPASNPCSFLLEKAAKLHHLQGFNGSINGLGKMKEVTKKIWDSSVI
jgi:hypothetical protein